MKESGWKGRNENMKESDIHAFMRPRDLRIIVHADTGVTPAEPDQYWSVSVTDAQVQNLSIGRCVTDSTDGQTSMKSLTKLIERCVREWKKEFEPKAKKWNPKR